jgi:hypothetical protein
LVWRIWGQVCDLGGRGGSAAAWHQLGNAWRAGGMGKRMHPHIRRLRAIRASHQRCGAHRGCGDQALPPSVRASAALGICGALSLLLVPHCSPLTTTLCLRTSHLIPNQDPSPGAPVHSLLPALYPIEVIRGQGFRLRLQLCSCLGSPHIRQPQCGACLRRRRWSVCRLGGAHGARSPLRHRRQHCRQVAAQLAGIASPRREALACCTAACCATDGAGGVIEASSMGAGAPASAGTWNAKQCGTASGAALLASPKRSDLLPVWEAGDRCGRRAKGGCGQPCDGDTPPCFRPPPAMLAWVEDD